MMEPGRLPAGLADRDSQGLLTAPSITQLGQLSRIGGTRDPTNSWMKRMLIRTPLAQQGLEAKRRHLEAPLLVRSRAAGQHRCNRHRSAKVIFLPELMGRQTMRPWMWVGRRYPA